MLKLDVPEFDYYYWTTILLFFLYSIYTGFTKSNIIDNDNGHLTNILIILTLCLLCPIIEESVFRSTFRQLFGNYPYISAISYGIIHLPNYFILKSPGLQWYHFLPQFIFSIVAGYYWFICNNLWLSLIHHCLINCINIGTGIIISVYLKKSNNKKSNNDRYTYYHQHHVLKKSKSLGNISSIFGYPDTNHRITYQKTKYIKIDYNPWNFEEYLKTCKDKLLTTI